MMEQAPTPGAEQQQQHKVSADAFYGTYHGHAPEHLATVRAALEEAGHPDTIWLAGDSSLDNKYWFDASAPALRGYDRVLSPPVMKQVRMRVRVRVSRLGLGFRPRVQRAMAADTLEELYGRISGQKIQGLRPNLTIYSR